MVKVPTIHMIKTTAQEKLAVKKKSTPAKPLRRAATYSDILTILNTKPKQSHNKLLYARFVIGSSVMFLLGIRISEVQHVTPEHIESLILTKSTRIYRPKTKDYYVYWTTDPGVELLKNPSFQSYLNIVFCNNTTLSGGIKLKTFAKTFNRYLQYYTPYNAESPISSHSFRIARITSLITIGVSIADVCRLIGHKDINTTLKYYRFSISPGVSNQLLSSDYSRMQTK